MSVVECKMNDFIKKNYHSKTVTKLSEELGVTRGTVTRRAKKMGLEKEITYHNEGEKISFLKPPLDKYFITENGVVVNSTTNKILKTKKMMLDISKLCSKLIRKSMTEEFTDFSVKRLYLILKTNPI